MEERLYKICGRKEDLDILEKALRHCEYLGNIGASRNILLRIDGDGNGRIKVYKVAKGVIYEQLSIDKEKYNIEQNNQQAFKKDIVGIYDIG